MGSGHRAESGASDSSRSKRERQGSRQRNQGRAAQGGGHRPAAEGLSSTADRAPASGASAGASALLSTQVPAAAPATPGAAKYV